MEFLCHTLNMEEIRGGSIQKEPENKSYRTLNSPIGLITLAASDNALVQLIWGQGEHSFTKSHKILDIAEAQLEEYFSGKRKSFEIPLAPKGTAFQMQVWKELLKIPFGSTITYGEQARRLGNSSAARATGAANGKNPIGIIIPCHRVIGASGSLTGFAGGIEIKKQLLEIETNYQNNRSV